MSENKQVFIIDSSQLNDWGLCHYKYYLRYLFSNEQGLRPIRQERSLDIGHITHELLRVYYLLKMRGLDHDRIVNSCLKRGALYTSKNSDLIVDDISMIFRIFREYASYYQFEQWIPLDVELPFVTTAFEDENYQILVQGKVDLVVKIPGVSDAVIVDHKTRSRIRPESKLDNQKIIYSKFLNIDTFIVNKLGLTKQDPKDKFHRESITYSADYVEEWFSEFRIAIKEMIAYKKINFFRREPTSCDKYSGCIFKRWCESEPKMRESLIGEVYDIGKKWDVGADLEKGVE
jgi:hypothetical protein